MKHFFGLGSIAAASLAGMLAGVPMASAASPCPEVTATDAGERNYAQGRCALEQRDYREAIRLLEALVAKDAYPVYRAELGRAYLGAQEFELARAQFRLALASDPPEDARKLLLVFLQMAEQEQTQAKAWFGTASVGYNYDSNINSGPLNREVTLFGLPFSMDESGMPKSDRALHAGFSAVHVKALDSTLSWQSNAGLDLLRYQTYHQYDTSQLSVDTGPHLSLAQGRADLYLPVGLSRSYLDSAPYATTRSFSPQLRYGLGAADTASLNLALARKVFAAAPAMSSSSQGLGLSWRHTLPNSWSLEPSLRYTAENAADAAYSNRLWSAGLALRGSLPARLRFSAEANVSRVNYLDAEAWADDARRDKRLNYALSLSRDLEGGYYLSLSWLRMRTLSNLALYSSERSQIQLQISKGF